MLTTINLALNRLEGDLNIPGLENCEKLSVVDVSGGIYLTDLVRLLLVLSLQETS